MTGKKIKFFSSIHFKIALVFTLTLVVTLELIGAVFIRQLERSSLASFRQQITLPAYVNDALVQQLEGESGGSKINSDIHTVLTAVNNSSITDIEVIDAKGIIRGVSDINNRSVVGQKTTDANLRAALSNSKYSKNPIEKKGNKRYQVIVKPLVTSTDGNSTVVGVVKVTANLEAVYDSLQQISTLYFSATLLAIALGIVMSLIISRALTKPISEISERTTRIARGDYSGEIIIRSRDEIGELGKNVNLLAERIEETTNSTEFERRRLDMVLGHMTDGVIATDRRGMINIINSSALNFLGIESLNEGDQRSIIQVLKIEEEYSLRELLEDTGEITLDFSTQERPLILKAYVNLLQRSSGFISGLVVVLHDVTEQERINEERRQFVSNVSHELRTPLTSVKSYIDA